MSDSMTATELLDGLREVGNLHEFAELFGFDWHDESDWTWHDVAMKMADDLEQLHEPIVRCKNCKHFGFFDDGEEKDYCGYWGSLAIEPDGFCKWGEKA